MRPWLMAAVISPSSSALLMTTRLLTRRISTQIRLEDHLNGLARPSSLQIPLAVSVTRSWFLQPKCSPPCPALLNITEPFTCSAASDPAVGTSRRVGSVFGPKFLSLKSLHSPWMLIIMGARCQQLTGSGTLMIGAMMAEAEMTGGLTLMAMAPWSLFLKQPKHQQSCQISPVSI